MTFYTKFDKHLCPWGPADSQYADQNGHCNPKEGEAHQHDPKELPYLKRIEQLKLRPPPLPYEESEKTKQLLRDIARSEMTYSPWRSSEESWRLTRRISSCDDKEQKKKLQEQYDRRLQAEHQRWVENPPRLERNC
jgi:hypothetical protein